MNDQNEPLYVLEETVLDELRHEPKAPELIRQLRGYSMIHVDLLHATRLFEQLQVITSQAGVDEDLAESLWWTATGKYGRCFNTAKVRVVRLDRTRFAASLSTEQKGVHAFLLDARDNHIAHASSAAHERASFVFRLEADGLKPIGRKVQSVSPNEKLVRQAADVCSTAAAFAAEMALEAGERFFPLVMRVDPETWRARAQPLR